MKNLDGSQVSYYSDRLMKAAPNRYKIVLQVANRAKHNESEKIDNLHIFQSKPVSRAIIEIAREMNLYCDKSLPETPTRKMKVAIESSLVSLRATANPQTWDTMLSWINSSIQQINPETTAYYTSAIVEQYPSKTCEELSQIIFLQKIATAAGLDFRKKTLRLNQVTAALSTWELSETIGLCVETILGIAYIYGIEATPKEQKLHIIDIFVLAFLNKRAVAAKIDWLGQAEKPLVLSGRQSALFKVSAVCATVDSARIFFQYSPTFDLNGDFLIAKVGQFLIDGNLQQSLQLMLQKAIQQL